MDDTSPEIKNEMRKRIMSLSEAERLVMGSRMFDASRQLVLSSFPKNLNDMEIREQFFLRLYKNDFSDMERRSIIEYLKDFK